jgi:acetyl-CoA synthetase
MLDGDWSSDVCSSDLDDLITSAGYRIGPSEIEDCLAGHPAVSLAAVVGKPDPIRTEIVKAFVKLKPGVTPDATLTEAIRAHVRTRLSAHEYPREIDFVPEIPLTTTGKVISRFFREQARDEAAAERRGG